MKKVTKFILRYLLVVIIACVLSCLGVYGNNGAVQALFTVLGVSFSIAMSIIITFDFSQVLNDRIRLYIATSIKNTRNFIIIDFIIATIVLLLSSLEIISSFELIIYDITLFHFQTFATCVTGMSIFYEVYNFMLIHDLHSQLMEKIIEERKNK